MAQLPTRTTNPPSEKFKPWVFKVGLPLTDAERNAQPHKVQKSFIEPSVKNIVVLPRNESKI